MKKDHSQEFIGIQYLRALAALSVAMFHIQEAVWGTAWRGLGAGVDVFFVISGFIIWKTTTGRSPWEWWKARFWRIVPLYWIYTTVAVLVAVHANQWVSVDHIVRSYLFIPTIDYRGLMMPVLGVGWTLNYEMLFYTAMAIVMLLTTTSARAVAIIAFLLGLVALRPLASEDSPVFFRTTSPVLLEFVAGIVIAVALPRLRNPSAIGIASIAAAIAFALLVSPDFTQRTISFGIPASMLVAGIVCLEPHVPRIGWLKLLGDASYSLYLSHLLTLIPVLWFASRTGVEGLPLFCLIFMVAISAGVLLYWFLERPLLAWSRSNRKREGGPGVALERPQ